MSLHFIAESLFWTSFAALAYTYVGYPLLVEILSRVRPRPVQRREGTPRVTFIITAYNEERDLAAKLENTLALDYPREKLEVIVASDCSTDATDDIACAFADRGVRLLRQPRRMGKTAAQNAAVEQARGEILVFSDATTRYRPDVLRALMPNFGDPTVGCVAGRLIYVDSGESGIGQGARSYWGYETFLKERESRIGSLIGVSGCLYAVRRSAYVPLHDEACSDFVIATKMVEQRLRTVFEPGAVCMEETNQQAAREFRMRVRIITRTFGDLWRHRAMMNPARTGFYAVQLLSHKVLRYCAPFFILGCLVTTPVLAPGSFLYTIAFQVQIACGIATVAALAADRLGLRIRVLAFPQYFLLANLASLIAFGKFLRGERYTHWDPLRGSGRGRAVP